MPEKTCQERMTTRRWPLLLLLIAGLSGFGYVILSGQPLLYESQDAGEKPLRLHVLANSDSPFDQQLKLALRDHIIVEMADELAAASDKQQAMALVEAALPELTASCQSFLNGRASYGVQLELARSDFPDIDYDGAVLAAGEYDALRIVLGEGAGHNWWCVLFPPLCFVDLAGEYRQDEALTVLAEYDRPAVEQAGWRVEWKLSQLWN